MTQPVAMPVEGTAAAGRPPAGIRFAVRTLMRTYLAALRAIERWGRNRVRQAAPGPQRLLLTLTFHAPNWALAHLKPLAASRFCAHITVVATSPLPPIEKVTVVMPPGWLQRVVGRVPARLATYAWLAVRLRPDYIGGFHLLFNGLAAALLARLVGARSMYFCVGGPMEVIGGGIWSENKLFERLRVPDPVVERQLVSTLRRFDLVVTMGERAKETFRSWGVEGRIAVIPGGIDGSTFKPSDRRDIDIIVVARLAPIKRIDLFLSMLRIVADQRPGVRAVVVGDGVMRPALVEMAEQLGLTANVSFVGHQSNVAEWLQRSRLFMLTSDSEGLALSLMEAMICGTVPVVSAVGELSTLVQNAENGYVVESRAPHAFAAPVLELLTSPARLEQCSAAALRTSRTYERSVVSSHWDGVLDSHSDAAEIGCLDPVASDA